MFAAGETKSGQDQVSAASSLSTEQRIQQWVNLVEQGAPAEAIKQAEVQVAEAMKQHPFEIKQSLPFFQNLIKKLDASGALQQFKLPDGRIVEDRRDHPQGEPAKTGKEAAAEAAKKNALDTARKEAVKERSKAEASAELRMKDGKLVQNKDQSYVNYLGGREGARGGPDQAVSEERVERMLSAFERMVIQRFEGGKTIAQKTADGKPHFLAKSEADWKGFFKSFLDRTVQKKVLVDEIRDFLMRGIVQKGMKGTFIGDMNLTNGRVEKFVRFSILADVLAKLKDMGPGDAVTKSMLGKLSGEELMYLALAASKGREFIASLLPSQGKFMGSRAEAQAAEALGIPLESQLQQRAKNLRGRKQGGLFGNELFEGDGTPEDLPYQFVPWWHWGRLNKPGRARRVTTVFYGALFIISIVGIVLLTIRLLKGG